MREIKFRAWDIDSKKMFFASELRWRTNGEFLGAGDTLFTEEGLAPAEKWSFNVMQYTGLKDKNGVAEVYEGDIIDTYGNIKGNIYEMDKRETDLVIQGFGTSSWEATNKEAMARGLKYSE